MTAQTGTTWGLIRGRHPMPVTGYVIEEEVSADPHDAERVYAAVKGGMRRLTEHYPGPYTILVTGLTTAAMHAVAVATIYQMSLPMGSDEHYPLRFAAFDRATDTYVTVLTVAPDRGEGIYEEYDLPLPWFGVHRDGDEA